ncbi:Xaa-Pro peptidase family protein [Micromonospora sp. 4G57]|uniref:Xaa-Pro peptidase family protein n=1 Tax=Micromonospora sicca TaxID=2202420 RepID=A0ABU5J8M1_9ACTN|nr:MULTISPECIES: Xaa-Pro peptidase family protein [unclassified Micromonospora]MDZ5443602.1 Xaa-Pro peptidase family protein [Micromonospora sp. 4G57]MDZ5488925.1 Xaa-Pro peptidase family protein [Micromonospora sp. 4G53]
MGIDELYPAERLAAAQRATAAAGLDALLLTPGSDLRYLTGYDAHAGERLTCLVLPAEGEPTLIVPVLERPAAEASPAPATGLRIVDHTDGTDPYPLVRTALPGPVTAVGLADRMWAEQVLALRATLPDAAQRLAGEVLRELRIRKSPAEVAALAEAGAAIDAVHDRMGEWLRPGRTETEVATDIAAAIRAAGHVTVDFVIVAAGPNGASPHHGTSDRPIGAGEPVVVDIGGTMPSGYRSDCTRTYVAGGPAPTDFAAYYMVLHEAQRAAVEAVRPGTTAEAVDAVARDLIAGAGYGEAFLHRTGHGIGLDGHEEPYVVAGNPRPLEAGMAFSIEPGIYLAGRHGARIEDIVVCTTDGVQRLNTTPTELIAL